jgi:hypothetical protein
MRAVTVHAGGHVGIAGPQQLAVLAGPVFLQLVHALVGLESLHIIGIRMAPAAELRNRRARGFAAIRVRLVGLIHGGERVLGQLRIRIASVAILAGEPGGGMHVVGELPHHLHPGLVLNPVQAAVTLEAGSLRGAGAGQRAEAQAQPHKETVDPHGLPPGRCRVTQVMITMSTTVRSTTHTGVSDR